MHTGASYPRSVRCVSLCLGRSPRVYYRSFGMVLSLLLCLALSTTGARAQVELTTHPSMTKGPAGAPVTIVEFSDYQ